MEQLKRFQCLEKWIKTQVKNNPFLISPASSDASFRRYFRVTFNADYTHKTLIAMDAPPQQESCASFLHVAAIFAGARVHVPDVLAQDLEQGFLLLSDLGNVDYLQVLESNTSEADHLYRNAVDALIKIQLISHQNILPDYDDTLLLRELSLFQDWYLMKHLQVKLSANQKIELDKVFMQIIKNNLAQPKVFVHRDYHSRNLMITVPNPGIIDFQDAVYGPITYDLVSLFKDAYIHWDEGRILDWVIYYWEKARKIGLPVAVDFSDFYRDFEWMGVQRHIKILGIFARLSERDGKHNYLQSIPRVKAYLRETCGRYREFSFLLALFDQLEDDKSVTKIEYTF